MWYEHFVNIFNPAARESTIFSVDEMIHDDVRPFTQMELKRSLKRMRHKAAPGPDLVPCSLLKRLSNTNQAQLLVELNMTLENLAIPPLWAKSHLIPIHKKGPIEDPSNYRPIMLESSILKCLTSLLEDPVSFQL